MFFKSVTKNMDKSPTWLCQTKPCQFSFNCPLLYFAQTKSQMCFDFLAQVGSTGFNLKYKMPKLVVS